MCILAGTVFPPCDHGISTFFRCPTYTGPEPAPGTVVDCPTFQDHRVHVDFPCARCSGADIYKQATPTPSRTASPAPEHQDPVETHDETLERARLARIRSEERMAREGTTLEEEHRRSCRSKAALAIARVWGARETRWQRLQVGFGIGDEFVPTPAQMEEVHEYMRVLREEEIAYEALEAQYEDDEAREARHEQREFQEQRMRDEAGEDEDEDDRVVEV